MITKFVLKTVLKIVATVLTLLLCAAVLLSAYAGCISPMVWAFPSILVLIFVPLAILLMVVAAIWLICRKWVIGVVCVLALMACGSTWHYNFPLHINRQDPKSDEMPMRLLTYNTHWLSNDVDNGLKISPTLSYIIAIDADIVCLQEFTSMKQVLRKHYPEQVDSLLRLYPYYVTYDDNEIVTMSKYPLHSIRNYKILSSLRSHTRLLDILEVDFKGIPINVANVHLSSYQLDKDQHKVLTSIREAEQNRDGVIAKLKDGFQRRALLSLDFRKMLDELPCRNMIICGDFNDVPGSYCYRTIMGDDFKDAYVQTGFGPMVTFNAWNMFFHIDQVLYRGDALRAVSCKRGSLHSSDHYPVVTEFAVAH